MVAQHLLGVAKHPLGIPWHRLLGYGFRYTCRRLSDPVEHRMVVAANPSYRTGQHTTRPIQSDNPNSDLETIGVGLEFVGEGRAANSQRSTEQLPAALRG
jgi:hypothetical protein